ncbi:hypothetical protein [Cesiribacter sp. SM1]|uniref:hypothetical protein n=1 Tax=Cesiribacter sp. SM1 TaxID=2861196 RepID=UPI001CD6A73B|nr:hypothetical protein [Cesiribacter sp. SM1]
MRVSLPFLLIAVTIFCAACKNKMMTDQNNTPETRPVFTPGPPAIVYKTRADYTDKVAVTLNEDKTAVVAYPHPSDINRAAGLPLPARLEQGYLLDNQGINAQVAFTSYTMQEYAALPQAPTPAELWAKIIDKDPLVYMCNCGNRRQYNSVETAMNQFIGQGLSTCKPVAGNKPADN